MVMAEAEDSTRVEAWNCHIIPSSSFWWSKQVRLLKSGAGSVLQSYRVVNGMDTGEGEELGSLLETYQKKSMVLVMRQSMAKK